MRDENWKQKLFNTKILLEIMNKNVYVVIVERKHNSYYKYFI